MLFIGAAITGGMALYGAYAKKKEARSRQKQEYKRVPSVYEGAKTSYSDFAKDYQTFSHDYMKSKPGLGKQEVSRMMRSSRQETAAGMKGARMRTQSYMSQRGIRGAGAAGVKMRSEETEAIMNYRARLNLLLNEHAIRESDITRRAAVGANFIWPAEKSRGAGSASGVTSYQQGGGDYLTEGVAMGARFAGEYYGGQGGYTRNNPYSGLGVDIGGGRRGV
jgi:gas vesicle protein